MGRGRPWTPAWVLVGPRRIPRGRSSELSRALVGRPTCPVGARPDNRFQVRADHPLFSVMRRDEHVAAAQAGCPSGQWERTVNPSALPSKVRILDLPHGEKAPVTSTNAGHRGLLAFPVVHGCSRVSVEQLRNAPRRRSRASARSAPAPRPSRACRGRPRWPSSPGPTEAARGPRAAALARLRSGAGVTPRSGGDAGHIPLAPWWVGGRSGPRAALFSGFGRSRIHRGRDTGG